MSSNHQTEGNAAPKVVLGNTPKTVIAFPYSGDYRVDVLIDGPLEKWSPKLAAGQDRTITYSFAMAEGYLSGPYYAEERDGFIPFTQAEKTAARNILTYISSIVQITFVEVVETTLANSPVGDIRMANNKQATSAGYAFSPSSTSSDLQLQGDIFMANAAIKESIAFGVVGFTTQDRLDERADELRRHLSVAIDFDNDASASLDGR